MAVPNAFGGAPSGSAPTSSIPNAFGGPQQDSGGGGGGFNWNPFHYIHDVTGYVAPIKSFTGLAKGAYQMLGDPLVNDVFALGDLTGAGFAKLGGNDAKYQELLQRASGSAHKALGDIESIPVGIGQIAEGVGADFFHPTPLRDNYDKLFQFINEKGAQIPGLSDETKAALLGPDGKGAKPQDLEALAKHQGLLGGLFQQGLIVSGAAGGVEAYAGAAADSAEAASTLGDPVASGATQAAGDASITKPQTGFDYNQPVQSAGRMAGAARDFTDLSPEDAAAKGESLRTLEERAHNVHHWMGFLGQSVAGFIQANKLEGLPGTADVAPPTVPTDATPEQVATAAASVDPTVAAAEAMSASHQASVSNTGYAIDPSLQAAIDTATAHVAGQAPVDVNTPVPDGYVRLYNGGGGDRTMWTDNPDRATSYKNTPGYGQGAIRHIDVPAAEAEAFKATAESPRDAQARAAGHQPASINAGETGKPADYYLTPQELNRYSSVEHPPEEPAARAYEPRQGPKLNVQEKPGLTPSGVEDAQAALDRAHQQAVDEHPVPEAVNRVGEKIAMPPPAWAVRAADILPDSFNRAIGHIGGGLVDRARVNEATRVFSHAMETAQNKARNSPLMMAGRAAAVDVLHNTDLGISREAAFRYVGEDVAAKATGEQLAVEFVNREGWNPLETSVTSPNGYAETLPPIAADVRASLENAARRGYTGLPAEVRNAMPPEAQLAYDQHIEAAVEGYKQSINETMTALLASRFGAHGFESALIDPNAPIMSPSDVKDYRRLMSDMRREQVYRSKQPTLVEAAKAAFIRQVALGAKQSDILKALIERRGITLQTMDDLRQGVPPGITPENIDNTVGLALTHAAQNETDTGFYGVTLRPLDGSIVENTTGFHVSISPQADVPIEEWNVRAPELVKEAIQAPKTPDGSGSYKPAQFWGSVDTNLGIWKHTVMEQGPDGTLVPHEYVALDTSMSTLGGVPLNAVQARVIGETFQQEAIWDNAAGREVRLSNNPNVQNTFAAYLDPNAPAQAQILDPTSNINRFINEQLDSVRQLREEIAQPVGSVRTAPSDAAVADSMSLLMQIDKEFADAGGPHKLGDLFNVDVRPGVRVTGEPQLYQTSMPFDMTTAEGVKQALARYDTAQVAKYLAWYPESHDFIENTYRGQTMPFTGRDAAEVFYDVLAVSSVMASPMQNLGRALMSFSNLEDFLSANKKAMEAAQSVMDRAMKLPPDVVYVQNIGKDAEGNPGYTGTESFGTEKGQTIGRRGQGTAVPVRYFETPEWRALTESTSMTTGPKLNIIDVLMGRLNLGEATNEDIAAQPANWTKAKSLSDANLPPGRIRYWAEQYGIQSPALDHMTELEQQIRDMQANRERPVEPQNVNPYVSDQAKAYAKEAGLPTPRTTDLNATANPVRGRVIADFYDKAESTPNDPAVVRSYNAFANEVIDQWEFLKKQGVHVEFVDRPESGGSYPDANAMIADVTNNHHLFVDRTGPGEEHLMPEMNAVVDHDAAGNPITTNDAFRAVHDYFGHAAAGNTFDRNGEDIAWRLHRQMFSKAAQPALFTETVGQNSYLNFHPDNYARRAAGGEAQFPEQKAMLFPEKMTNPKYLPTITDAKAALRSTMHDPSLAPAYEQAMMEHGGQSSWAKMRSFRQNLSDPYRSLSVTQDSVMAQFYGMRATDWNLKSYPGSDAPPEAGSVWADKSDEVRAESVALSHLLNDKVMPSNVQSLLWVFTKEYIGTQDWGRLVAHNDAANAMLDTIKQTLDTGGKVDPTTVHPLEDWWQEELAPGRAYSMLQSEKASLEQLQKDGEILTPQEQSRLDELGSISPRATQQVTVDLTANQRANLQDTANRMLEQQTRYSIQDAGEIAAKERSYQKYLKEVEAPIQKAIAEGNVDEARSILDEYVAKWERSIKGDAEGGNFADVAKKSMLDKNTSTFKAVANLQDAKYVPTPGSVELTPNELHDAFDGKVRGSVTVNPGTTGRLLMKLFHEADLSTLVHEGAHLMRLMSPGDVMAQLSQLLPHLQDAELTPARIADEEKFAAWFTQFLHDGAATGRVPPGLEPLFTNVARVMSKTYGPAFGLPGGESIPQPIIDYFDGIFNKQVVRPDQVTDPLSLHQIAAPSGLNPVQRPWETDNQFAARTRKFGEARVQIDVQANQIRQQAARVAKINDVAAKMEKLLPLGGEAGVENLKKADALAAKNESALERLTTKLENAEGNQVPRVWRDITQAFLNVAELAKADTTGQLAEHLGEIPDNFAKVLRYAAERGFEPTYVPDLTWQMAAKHLFNHLNLSTSLEEAGLRKENVGTLDRLKLADRSLEALGTAQVVAMKELYQDQLVAHIEKFYAQPHTPGEKIPEGWRAWDAVRKGIILGRDRAGDTSSVNATAIVPEGVDNAIKAMSQDYSKWPFRFLFKGGPTSVWKDVLMTFSPGWYVKHFTGTAILTTMEGVSLADYMKALRMAVKKDAFGFRWADVPDEIKGRSVYRELGDEMHKPGSSAVGVSLRDIARNEGLKEAANQVRFKMRNVVQTIDAFGRTAVYVKTLRTTGSPELAAERAYTATGDFTAMGPFERGLVSAVIPFYAFQKAMLRILVRLPLEHPLAAGLFMNQAQMHDAYMQSILGGPIPDQLLGASFYNGQLGDFSKVVPFVDSAKLLTPEGIASSAHPLIQLAIQQAFGAPSFEGSAHMGTYGQLEQQPDWFQSIADSFSNSALGSGTLGVAQGDLASLGGALVPRVGRTWSQKQYDQLIKRIARTQASLNKLKQPGSYVSPPDVVVPSQHKAAPNAFGPGG